MHVLRHSVAMDLLQQGVDRSVIALWLGQNFPSASRLTKTLGVALEKMVRF